MDKAMYVQLVESAEVARVATLLQRKAKTYTGNDYTLEYCKEMVALNILATMELKRK